MRNLLPSRLKYSRSGIIQQAVAATGKGGGHDKTVCHHDCVCVPTSSDKKMTPKANVSTTEAPVHRSRLLQQLDLTMDSSSISASVRLDTRLDGQGTSAMVTISSTGFGDSFGKSAGELDSCVVG